MMSYIPIPYTNCFLLPTCPPLSPPFLPGKGEFGEVYLAGGRCVSVPGSGSGAGDSSTVPDRPVVMVKSLLDVRDEQAVAEFAREAEMFAKVTPHAAVARLVALLREAEPHLLVLEYSDWVSQSATPGVD